MLYIIFKCTFLTLCFFANDLLLALHFIFILKGNDVRQKGNSSNFLIQVQLGGKAAETT